MSKEKMQSQASMENIYTLDGKVPLLKSIPFGLQHVLAMFVANIAPIMIVTGAGILLLAGIFPAFGAVLATLPEAVLGGCTIMMFGNIVISGLQMIGDCGFTQRNITIAALSLSVGLGFTQVPEMFNIFPSLVRTIFAENCVAVVFLTAKPGHAPGEKGVTFPNPPCRRFLRHGFFHEFPCPFPRNCATMNQIKRFAGEYMNGVNKTLYIPLYGKSYVSKKGIILHDPKAEEILAVEGFALKGKSRSKWLAYYMGCRAAVFDDWVKQQLAAAPDAVVIHLGCGMDSRVMRVGAESSWYDVDFPEVIAERKRYFAESDGYRMIGADVTDPSWLDEIPKVKRAIVVMEGISMYLSPKELLDLTANLCAHFEELSLLMDCYTELAARMSKYKNPINDVGVTQVYGMDDPEALQQGDLRFVTEPEMTPQKYVDQLSGMEKTVFRKLYAGDFSKKLYRLFEYRKG